MDPLRKYPHIIQLFACIVNLFVFMFLLKLSHPIVNHPNLISSRMLGAVDVLPVSLGTINCIHEIICFVFGSK